MQAQLNPGSLELGFYIDHSRIDIIASFFFSLPRDNVREHARDL